MFIHGDTVKLGDFGFCTKGANLMIDTSFIGSVAFQAPEIHQRKEYSIKTDVYSTGMCFYEMLMGQLPFGPEAIHDILKAKLEIVVQNKSGVRLLKSTMDLLRQMLNPVGRRRVDCDEISRRVKGIME